MSRAALLLAWLVVLLCAGGAAAEGQLLSGYRDGFGVVAEPPASRFASEGRSRKLAAHPESSVWRALLTVMMQRAPVVRISRESRTLVAPPFAVRVEHSDGLLLQVLVLRELVDGASPEEPGLASPAAVVEAEILDQLETQLEASRKLEQGGSWSYLDD